MQRIRLLPSALISKITTDKKMTVNNLKDFLKARMCSEKTFAQVERNTFKYTDCGAWITQNDEGITVGSIVEGVDWGTDTHTLRYPFEIQDFWDALQAVEDEANEIWHDTHGCDDCGMEHPEWGTQMINLECKTCQGEGVII